MCDKGENDARTVFDRSVSYIGYRFPWGNESKSV